MDGRKNNGAVKGNNNGAGRKPKADEILLIEKLTPLDDIAFEKLKEGVEKGNYHFIKLYYEYRFGKPKQLIGIVSEKEDVKQIFKIGGVEIEL